MAGVRNITSHKNIMRNIKNMKKRKMKNSIQKPSIINYEDLEKYCISKSEIPESQTESYVARYFINKETKRFGVIWSSRVMIARKNSNFDQNDATYKLNWHELPVNVTGLSTPSGVFYQTSIMLSSHEDHLAWEL